MGKNDDMRRFDKGRDIQEVAHPLFARGSNVGCPACTWNIWNCHVRKPQFTRFFLPREKKPCEGKRPLRRRARHFFVPAPLDDDPTPGSEKLPFNLHAGALTIGAQNIGGRSLLEKCNKCPPQQVYEPPSSEKYKW